jgi:hypothetical protein
MIRELRSLGCRVDLAPDEGRECMITRVILDPVKSVIAIPFKHTKETM